MMKWNGVAGQKGMYVNSNCSDRNCYWSHSPGVFVTLSVKPRRNHVETCQVNLVSTYTAGKSWFGGHKLKMAKTNSVYGSKITNSHTSSEAVFQESAEIESVQEGKDGPDMDSFQQNLPPWGNLMVEEGSEISPETVSQAATSLTNEFTVDESQVDFLEEPDEEELSKRIVLLSRSNKVRSALALFRSMEFSGLNASSHACNSLLSCLIRNKLPGDALKVFEFMKLHDAAAGHAYSLILKAIADSQGCDSAIRMFVELSGSSSEKKDFDVIVYNTMISICGRVNNWLETERIWGSMKENGYHGTEVTYRLLVSIFVRCGQNELAFDAYQEMIENGLKPRVDTMHAIIGAGAKEEKWDLALNVFQNMVNDGLKPNLVACNALINALGKAREVKLAFKLFEVVKFLGHTPDAYTWNGLLNGLYRAEQYGNALQLFEIIKTEQSSLLNEHLYNTALMSCQKLGLWDKAIQLLWHAETSRVLPSTATYNLVIGACEVARKPKIALEVYERMVHKKCTPDTFTYLSLIRGCVWASLWIEVEEILDISPNVSLYNAVIHGMCLRGKVESAKKLYTKMRDIGLKPDGKTRALMLQNLRKCSTKRRWSSLRPR